MQRINRLLTVLAIIGSACTFGVSQTPTQPVSPPGKAAGQSSTANTTGTGACIGCQDPEAGGGAGELPGSAAGRRPPTPPGPSGGTQCYGPSCQAPEVGGAAGGGQLGSGWTAWSDDCDGQWFCSLREEMRRFTGKNAVLKSGNLVLSPSGFHGNVWAHGRIIQAAADEFSGKQGGARTFQRGEKVLIRYAGVTHDGLVFDVVGGVSSTKDYAGSLKFPLSRNRQPPDQIHRMVARALAVDESQMK